MICCGPPVACDLLYRAAMMSANGRKPVSHQQPVLREILQYLVEHPDAKDTIDGVVWWWLPRGCLNYRDEEVRHALNRLVSRRWLVASRITKSTVVYGVVAARLGHIRRFLKITAGRDLRNAR